MECSGGVIKYKIVQMWSWYSTDCWLSLAPTHHECCTSHEPLSLFYYRNITWFVCVCVCVWVCVCVCVCCRRCLRRSIYRVRKLLSRCLTSIVRTQSDCSYMYVTRYRLIAFPLNALGGLWSLIVAFPGHRLPCMFFFFF